MLDKIPDILDLVKPQMDAMQDMYKIGYEAGFREGKLQGRLQACREFVEQLEKFKKEIEKLKGALNAPPQ